MRLKDKVAIVTGAGRGIGEAIVYRFVEEGAKVTLCDVDEPALKEVESKVKDMNGSCLLAVGDIVDSAFVKAMVDNTVKTFETLDVMINNAAITGQTINCDGGSFMV
jgi:3-oxoacyl-[acyl-carrier protein] reductase